MKLETLLQNITFEKKIEENNSVILGITQDSRYKNVDGFVYVAVVGTQSDGHDYITDVISNGIHTVVCEKLPKNIQPNINYIVVKDTHRAVGEIASLFYKHPSQELKIIAVTGTNGKTTCATYAYQLLESFSKKTLLFSTAGDFYNGKKISLERKAPSSLEVIELHKNLRDFVDQGAEYCCLEATSQALDQYRLAGVDIDVAIYTNLEQDHLDYHKTFEHYRDSKKKLFDGLLPTSFAVINADDENSDLMVKDTAASIVGYGLSEKSQRNFSINSIDFGAISIRFHNYDYTIPVIGIFNVYNVIAVVSALEVLGFNSNEIFKNVTNLKGVPGRLESVPNNKKLLALVDYAHSPGALESVLTTLKDLPHNSLITVVGCGGDRDRSKRPMMVQATQQNSDYVIYTADNPRTENLDQIFNDMKQGLDTEASNYHFVESREKAIQQAVTMAKPQDIVVVAGKGHEDYQVIGTKKIHFDDREILEKYL